MAKEDKEVTFEKEEGKELWHIKVGFGFGDDAKKHLMAGVAVSVSVYALCGGRAFGVLLGIIVAILIAFCKECYDYFYRRDLYWDWSDVVWMLIGGFIGGIVSTISYALW